MSRHPEFIEGYTCTIESLVKEIFDIGLPFAYEFIRSISEEIKRQSDSDRQGGRIMLSDLLRANYEILLQAEDKMKYFRNPDLGMNVDRNIILAVGKMSYDRVAYLYDRLAFDTFIQGKVMIHNNRKNEGNILYSTFTILNQARDHMINEIWEPICEKKTEKYGI